MNDTSERLPIQYSVGLKYDAIRQQTKACATILERGTVSIDAVAEELSRKTTLTATDVKAVLQGFMEFSVQHLLNGYRVSLGDIGTLHPTLKVKGAASADACDASTIEGVRCRFRPSHKLRTQLDAINAFTKVLSAKEKKAAIGATDAEIEQALEGQ